MLKVQLLERAELEVRDAYAWYETQQPGLGDRFLDMVDHYLTLIGSNPHQYPGRYGNELHVAPMKTFPYLVVYWVDEGQETVFVTSIFHTSRKPKKF
ncbi:type II toxin-antitoxin system RelE/ParE family toxin [Pontibacter pamirensis]|uniref:type II toxin-antitoxin system RelE/ParE family toxin n=1 Tax=Pontibacter pamirensis TaxID=2562824 RepID=UPI00138A06C3|nr:type II toxin-antitoxin system RelE/ParE family toxin [Pontibacter pamirensis]